MENETSKPVETANSIKPVVSGSIIFLSYTIYIVLYEALVIGGCGYVTFGLDRKSVV